MEKKIFSSQDFSSIFETKYITGSPSDTICKVITQMADKNMTISTPAGTFNSFKREGKHISCTPITPLLEM